MCAKVICLMKLIEMFARILPLVTFDIRTSRIPIYEYGVSNYSDLAKTYWRVHNFIVSFCHPFSK